MECPTCKTVLQRCKRREGLYWVCKHCGGRGLNISVFRKRTDNDVANYLWRKVYDSPSSGIRKCPACGKRMAEVPMPAGRTQVKLDGCKRCQFIWFDPEELDVFPMSREVRAKDELSPEAKRELALIEVRMMGERLRASEDPAGLEELGLKAIPAVMGLPVEDDACTVSSIPWATWIVAGLVALFSISSFQDLRGVVDLFGFIPSEPFRFMGLTFFSSFFIHAGWWHLISNLYFLIVFGDNVEEILSIKRFIILILLSTLAGNIVHLIFFAGTTTPCVGASGGISGIIAFYAFSYPFTNLRIFFRFFWGTIPVYLAFIIWVLFQIIGLRLLLEGESSTASTAHLGGCVVGIIFWLCSNSGSRRGG